MVADLTPRVKLFGRAVKVTLAEEAPAGIVTLP